MTASAMPQTRPRAAPGFRLYIATICLYWLSLYLFVPLLSPRAADLGAKVGGVGLVLAAYGLAQFLFRVPTGWWSDRLGRRRPFLFAALGACTVAAAGMGLARTPAALGLFRGVSGLGACGWVVITVMFTEFLPPAQTARALGLISFIATAAQLLGQFAGGLIAAAAGFGAAFLAAAIAGLAAIVLCLFVPEPAVRARAHGGASLPAALRSGAAPGVLLAAGLAIAMQYVTFVTVFGFVPLVAATRFGAGGAALGLLAAGAGVPSALASLGSGRLAGAIGQRGVGALGFALAGCGTAAIPLAPSLAALAAAAATIGLGLGVLNPTLMTAAVQGIAAERRGLAMGLYQALYAVGMFGGPAAAGLIGRALGDPGLFGTTALLALAAAAVAWSRLARA